MSYVVYDKVTLQQYGAFEYKTRHHAENSAKRIQSRVSNPENIRVVHKDTYKYFITDKIKPDQFQLMEKLKEAHLLLNAVSISNPDYQNRIDKLNAFCDNRFGSKSKK
jgi:hypothetical protein